MTGTYRHCAAIALFRPSYSDGNSDPIYQILLVHKPRKNDAWQLPQGGQEAGETLEEAALRELNEEAGLQAATVFGTSDTVYQYNFPAAYRRFRPDNVCGQRVQYVLAVTDEGVVVQVDDDEIDDYAWVLPEQLSQYIKRQEYLTIVDNLYREGLATLSA